MQTNFKPCRQNRKNIFVVLQVSYFVTKYACMHFGGFKLKNLSPAWIPFTSTPRRLDIWCYSFVLTSINHFRIFGPLNDPKWNKFKEKVSYHIEHYNFVIRHVSIWNHLKNLKILKNYNEWISCQSTKFRYCQALQIFHI